MDSFISLIQQVGFPIALAVYLFARFEKILNAQTEAFQGLVIFLKSKFGA